MVVFTCGHCGESVQKPKVEKHYMTKCRNRTPNLSCMDCFKDFYGNDYEAHTKCITEEQRYSGKGFVAKTPKGEQKQNAWVEMVQSVLSEQKSVPPPVIRIVQEVSKHTNTPRKKPKFINFVKNVCGHRVQQNDIEAAWNLIAVKLDELKLYNNKNQNNEVSKESNKSELDTVNEENNDTINESKTDKAEDDVNENATESKADGEHTKTKKELKAERKKQKYEKELKKASEKLPEEETVEEDEKAVKKRKTLVSESESITNGKSKKKKPKKEEEEINLHDQNVNSEVNAEQVKFNWNEFILDALRKKGNEMPLHRLQKKVLAAYSEVTGKEVTDRIVDKLGKKVFSTPNVKIIKDKVMLQE